MSSIYNYYESAIHVEKDIYKYKCKVCLLINEKAKDGKDYYAKTHGNTASNLISHMQKATHATQYEEYLLKDKAAKLNSPANKKRKLEFSPATTPSKMHNLFNNVSTTPKYTSNSLLQKTR